MRARKVKTAIRSTDEVLKEAAETMKTVAGGKRVKAKGHRLFFTSPEALRRFLTPRGLELIRVIRRRPGSISELAVTLKESTKMSWVWQTQA